jgi:hypothetical protein
VLVVHQLAGVLLDMDAFDADRLGDAFGRLDLDRPLADQRVVKPVRTASRMHASFGTGSIPGIAASTRLTWVFGSAPKAVAAPENSLALVLIWAWTSRPTTISHGPVAPSMM